MSPENFLFKTLSKDHDLTSVVGSEFKEVWILQDIILLYYVCVSLCVLHDMHFKTCNFPVQTNEKEINYLNIDCHIFLRYT